MYLVMSLFMSFFILGLFALLLLLACAYSVLSHKAATSHLWRQFAARCFSSCSVPKQLTHNCSSLGCPCPRCPRGCPRVCLCLPQGVSVPAPGCLCASSSLASMSAQPRRTKTIIACGHTRLGWPGSQAVWQGCSRGQTAGPCLLCLRLPLYTVSRKILTQMVFVWMQTLCSKLLIPLGT